MTPREFRQEQNFEFDHFTELTSTGIRPNYANIELFAHEYHQAKLKLLGIANVLVPNEEFPYDAKCDDACKFYCTKGGKEYPECLNQSPSKHKK